MLHGGACRSNPMQVQVHIVSYTIIILKAADSRLEAVQLPYLPGIEYWEDSVRTFENED